MLLGQLHTLRVLLRGSHLVIEVSRPEALLYTQAIEADQAQALLQQHFAGSLDTLLDAIRIEQGRCFLSCPQ